MTSNFELKNELQKYRYTFTHINRIPCFSKYNNKGPLPINIIQRMFSYDAETGLILSRLNIIIGDLILRKGDRIYNLTAIMGEETIKIFKEKYKFSTIVWILNYSEYPAMKLKYRDNRATNLKLDNLYLTDPPKPIEISIYPKMKWRK